MEDLDIDEMFQQAAFRLGKNLADVLRNPDTLRNILESAVHIIKPGDTVLIRYNKPITAEEAYQIFHRMEPLAIKGGFAVALIDNADEIRIMRRQDRAQPTHQAPAPAEEHQESLPQHQEEAPPAS